MAVPDGHWVRLTCEAARNDRQGVYLLADRGVHLEGVEKPQQTVLVPCQPGTVVRAQVFSTEGLLSVFNVWESEKFGWTSQSKAAGMLVEDLSDTARRYQCCDVELEFDALVFRVERE